MNIFDIRIEDNNKVYRWSWQEMLEVKFRIISTAKDNFFKAGDIVTVKFDSGHYVLYKDKCWFNCEFTEGWVLERIKA